MKIKQVSFGFASNKVKETQTFYEEHLGATALFETEGYACLKLGDVSNVLSIESPQAPESTPSDMTGLGIGIAVDDVDLAYEVFTGKHLNIEMPLKDHPWGQRGFGIKDPNDLPIDIYSITGSAPTNETAEAESP